MESDHQRITIIGTGCIGASLGLALRQSRDAYPFLTHGILGRETLLRGIEATLDHLTQLQKHLNQGDIDVLETAIDTATKKREARVVEVINRDWQNKPDVTEREPLFRRTMRALVGEGLAGKNN